MEKYIIIDTTENTGKPFIAGIDANNVNTSDIDQAETFNNKGDALNYIMFNGWEKWARVAPLSDYK